MRFVKESVFAAPARELFAFHERPDAFSLLLPPWRAHDVITPPRSLEVGTRVLLRARIGPIWQTLEAVHVAYEPGRSFTDELVRGPFRRWVHHHVVEPRGPDRSLLRDEVEYELPFGVLGQVAGGWFARRELERLFVFRHEVTRAHVERRG